jgi:hypothetical protein
MKSIRKVAVGLCAAGLAVAAAPSFALPSLTFVTGANGTQTVDPFGGFDYISNASAVSTAPIYDSVTLVSQVLTTTYLASANAILDPSGNVYFTPGIAPPTPSGFSPWEFTIKATITETAKCTVGTAAACTQAAFTATGGTFEIYYDSTADANRDLGTGYLDGTKVLGGNILPGLAGSFQVAGTGGTGNFSFKTNVLFTETDTTKDAYIDPELVSSIAGAEIKIGGSTTAWTAPTTWVDGGGIDVGELVFQADGNHSFSMVPEPASLALLGIGLFSLVGASRLRRS